jgi:hypothetical protein
MREAMLNYLMNFSQINTVMILLADATGFMDRFFRNLLQK